MDSKTNRQTRCDGKDHTMHSIAWVIIVLYKTATTTFVLRPVSRTY